MSGTVFIIGTETLSLQQQLDIIRRHGVICIIDVRNYAETLAQKLKRIQMREFFYSNQIHYRDYSSSLSMDVQERKFQSANGFVDFAKYRSALGYSTSLTKIQQGVDRGYNCCILGYRDAPEDCHRSILVGHGLLLNGIDALHITSNAAPITQSELEERMVEQAFPKIDQMTLFDVPQQPFEKKLDIVLRQKNKDLGKRWLAERNDYNAGEEPRETRPRWLW